MPANPEPPRDSANPALEDDSAVAVLRHLDEERGKMFSESEYQEMRQAVLDELAHGARLRPFTIFTFGILALGLVAMLIVGLVHATGKASTDHALAIASGLALGATAYFFWSCVRGVKQDTLRSLDARLSELEKLRESRLVSPDEYQTLQAHILMARQRRPEA